MHYIPVINGLYIHRPIVLEIIFTQDVIMTGYLEPATVVLARLLNN